MLKSIVKFGAVTIASSVIAAAATRDHRPASWVDPNKDEIINFFHFNNLSKASLREFLNVRRHNAEHDIRSFIGNFYIDEKRTENGYICWYINVYTDEDQPDRKYIDDDNFSGRFLRYSTFDKKIDLYYRTSRGEIHILDSITLK